MKKTIIITASVLVIAMFFAFRTLNIDKSEAKAKQVEGIYVFNQCTPVAEYTYLGTVECPYFVKSVKPEGILTAMLKELKKNYSSADGIIFADASMEKADAIKFKDE